MIECKTKISFQFTNIFITFSIILLMMPNVKAIQHPRLYSCFSNISKDDLRRENDLMKEFSTGSFYWYGRDCEGSPNLWYRVDRMEWESIVLKKRMQYTDLVMQNVFKKVPSIYSNINFILLLDDFSPIQAMRHPRIGSIFLRSFLKACPEDGLKTAVMVTGTTGNIFYSILKGFARSDFLKKVIVVRNRENAASVLLKKGIVQNNLEVPTFLGGRLIHDDYATKTLIGMLSTLQ